MLAASASVAALGGVAAEMPCRGGGAGADSRL